ncbi:hypothetical protein [Streptomyces mirabilis]|uniref:hypothetical protein n=1 Tax=Streptomyces mirabilis TaxID=68239 RepID=UPI00369A4FCD
MVTILEERVGFRRRSLARHARRVAPAAADLVRSRIGALPPIKLVLTGDPNHMAQVASQSELDLVPGVSPRTIAKGMRRARRNARTKQGVTALAEHGVLVVVNLANVPTNRDVNAVLVHEFTHGHQLGDPYSRVQHLAYCQHEFRISVLPRRDIAAIEALIARREIEAEQAEYLAAQLPA